MWGSGAFEGVLKITSSRYELERGIKGILNGRLSSNLEVYGKTIAILYTIIGNIDRYLEFLNRIAAGESGKDIYKEYNPVACGKHLYLFTIRSFSKYFELEKILPIFKEKVTLRVTTDMLDYLANELGLLPSKNVDVVIEEGSGTIVLEIPVKVIFSFSKILGNPCKVGKSANDFLELVVQSNIQNGCVFFGEGELPPDFGMKNPKIMGGAPSLFYFRATFVGGFKNINTGRLVPNGGFHKFAAPVEQVTGLIKGALTDSVRPRRDGCYSLEIVEWEIADYDVDYYYKIMVEAFPWLVNPIIGARFWEYISKYWGKLQGQHWQSWFFLYIPLRFISSTENTIVKKKVSPTLPMQCGKVKEMRLKFGEILEYYSPIIELEGVGITTFLRRNARKCADILQRIVEEAVEEIKSFLFIGGDVVTRLQTGFGDVFCRKVKEYYQKDEEFRQCFASLVYPSYCDYISMPFFCVEPERVVLIMEREEFDYRIGSQEGKFYLPHIYGYFRTMGEHCAWFMPYAVSKILQGLTLGYQDGKLGAYNFLNNGADRTASLKVGSPICGEVFGFPKVVGKIPQDEDINCSKPSDDVEGYTGDIEFINRLAKANARFIGVGEVKWAKERVVGNDGGIIMGITLGENKLSEMDRNLILGRYGIRVNVETIPLRDIPI